MTGNVMIIMKMTDGISETHLYDGQKVELSEYKWYGQNRTKHIKTRKGSGGIGILVKNSLLNYYKVEILDSETEGILLLSFSSKYNDGGFCCNVCYVPPLGSTRAVDLSEFYDVLMCQVNLYCKDTFFFICGDFNARCGNLKDFIPGVDNISETNAQ